MTRRRLKDLVPVLIEPLQGHTDEAVVQKLKKMGARTTKVLAPGFISAMIRKDSMERLREIAYVREKPLVQPSS